MPQTRVKISWTLELLTRDLFPQGISIETRLGSAWSDEVWPLDLDSSVCPRGIPYAMKRDREMERERDELDSLAAEAGHSAGLVAMTALILVMALVLGFVV